MRWCLLALISAACSGPTKLSPDADSDSGGDDGSNGGIMCRAPAPAPAAIACQIPSFLGEMSASGRAPDPGPYSWNMASGDLDADGNVDVVIAGSDNAVSVVLGRGFGRFAPPTQYTVISRAIDVAVGDLDGNGSLDIAVVSMDFVAGAGAVSALLNHGDGSFSAAVAYSVANQPSKLALADADLDGDRDVFVAQALYGSGGGVTVLRNDGTGVLAAQRSYSTRAGMEVGTNNVAVADVSGDGRVDIIALNGNGNLAVLLGRANGFSTAALYPMGFVPKSLVVKDLTGDGLDDVAATVLGATFGEQNPRVAVLANQGAAGFSAATYYPLLQDATGLAAGDMDNDGDVDLVAAEYGVSVLTNVGDGTFATVRRAPVPAGPLALSDVDANGALDVLTSYRDKVVLLQGDGAAGILEPAVLPLGGRVRLRDANGDGKLDLFGVGDGVLGVALGHGDGTFGAAIAVTTMPTAFAVADLDLNGKLDLVTVAGDETTPGSVSVWKGNGDGTFTSVGIGTIGVAPKDVVTGDVNGDCVPDVIVANAGFAFRGVSIPPSLEVYVNTPNAGLSLAWSRRVGYRFITSGDFNSDDRLDLVAGSTYSPTQVLFGHGDGSFSDPTTIATTPISNLDVADVNEDGHVDVVGPGVLLGDGQGGFAATQTALGLPVSAGDVDGDGHTDIIASHDVLFGHGDGTFSTRSFLWLGAEWSSGASTAIGDVTGDGRPDIVTGHSRLLEQQCLQ